MKKSIFAGLILLGVSSPALALDFSDQLELPEFSEKTVWIVRAGVGFNGVVGSNKETMKKSWNAQGWAGDFKGTTGYDFSVAFNKSFGGSPMYWGMELGFGMRGYKYDTGLSNSKTYENDYLGTSYIGVKKEEHVKLTAYNVRLSPFTFGYRYTFLDRMAADIHLGAFASFDFGGTYKADLVNVQSSSSDRYGYHTSDKSSSGSVKIGDIDGYHRFDAGLNLGIGYWFGHFNIDFTWQRGFIPYYDNGDDDVEITPKKGKSYKVKRGNLYDNSFVLRLGYAF